jgi:hypothetical protein
MKRLLYLLLSTMLMTSCTNSPKDTAAPTPASFAFDCRFIQGHDSGAVLLRLGDAQVLVSPKYQGKVFTSTAEGDDGPSFGWVNYKAFSGPPDPHMNAYGGENRLWLGPEGGPFSLFFQPGTKMEVANWHTPAAFDTEAWDLVTKSDTLVRLQKGMELTNYAGTRLSIGVERTVRILDSAAMEVWLETSWAPSVKAVGYQTQNRITNTGSEAWTEKTGMPCLWMLDMFPPSAATTIIIPYKPGRTLPANTGYFGEIPHDRIRYADSTLFFRADGKSRGKLGVMPSRVRPVAGSYDSARKILTIILFDTDPLGGYLNQEWRTDRAPFSGDAMNAYNDGPLADGHVMGPFYELESVSTAAYLAPGQSLTHRHSVFHFTGDEPSLDHISRSVLGVSLKTISTIFHD